MTVLDSGLAGRSAGSLLFCQLLVLRLVGPEALCLNQMSRAGATAVNVQGTEGSPQNGAASYLWFLCPQDEICGHSMVVIFVF